MSTSVLLPPGDICQEERNMRFYNTPGHYGQTLTRRCAGTHSPSPSRDRGRDKSPRIVSPKHNTARVNSSHKSCHKSCQENQSSLVHSLAQISLCDTTNVPCDTEQKKTGETSSSCSISGPELAELMQRASQLIILDCRSFISYNLCHVKGAINVGCADRVTKRRLQSGKICVSDLIKCTKAREQFAIQEDSEIVIYDDDTTEIIEGSCGSNTSLHLILNSLQKGIRKIHILKGGLVEFHARFEHLCNKAKAPASTPLYSPTTPIISNEIDTAIASRVLPFLYIGNERDVANKERLQEIGITHILNVTSHIPFYFEDVGSIRYKRLQASDSGSQNLKQYFQEASEFIEDVRKSEGKVIVHCQAGVSRSATITMAYIMQYSTLTMNEVFKFVKNQRAIIAPNFNFMGQLMEFERSLNEGKIKRAQNVDLGIQPVP